MNKKYGEEYPSIGEIVYLLGMGTLLVGTILMPGLGYAARMIDRAKKNHEWKESQRRWKKFNLHALKRNLRRLRDQKIVEIVEKDGEELIKLTQKGHTKYLKFRLEELSLNGKKWDGKWRIVIYDIAKFKKNQVSAFRYILKYINFFQLQKSVYLTPYPCDEQISYLREYFGIGGEVLLLRVDRIENESFYRQYFGL
ncbi:hypothetical protein A3J19_04400 [Candidatus Daviesbacteria bacterium RIFCSPLOWO2_02_FULL_41_8]|uniref:Transcriptional repressor PaaX-like central Cas2-like domain-containing protein n=2 Tax=Candidatus Daviesiibacteriota TaxID=1752718 RepID=A0A1F5NIS2_9BACT|nr:MAG: hypothetical protein A3D83_00875 [Candidatus Daviesbacteria bacterium RIFCSPHIGHO2_02_FULL_41_10]OGE77596.1 MAG: hypothetical protein A3J19_04400 [Candidatus Daviesbacteria bacterium RIFCSPLOWO2_02_FULL_41_8]